MKGTLLIDFDSTLIQTETLEVLSELVAQNTPSLCAQIAEITNLTMSGKLDFYEALTKRIALIKPSRTDIQKATQILSTQITASFFKHKAFIREHADSIYIVSGGFKAMIVDIAAEFGIHPSHVYANDFVFEQDIALSVNSENLMAHTDGKARLIAESHFEKPVVMLGDGMSDALTSELNPDVTFIAFTENVRREVVCQKASFVAENFEQVLNALR